MTRFITAEEEREITARHRDVLRLIAAGKTNAEIIAELWITPSTLSKHTTSIFLRLGVTTRVAAARWWWENVELAELLHNLGGQTWPG